MHYNAGYDHFTPDPGLWETCDCKICGTRCDVRRDVTGYTSWAGAMSKKSRKHDAFSCPNAGKTWHDEAFKLVEAIKNMPSKRVKALMELDLNEVIVLGKGNLKMKNWFKEMFLNAKLFSGNCRKCNVNNWKKVTHTRYKCKDCGTFARLTDNTGPM